jgi:hypothetical protein
MTPEEGLAKRKVALQKYNASEKRKATQKRYYEKNRELCAERVKACYESKREHYSQKSMEWQRNNHERHLEIRRHSYAKNSAKEIARVRRRQGKIKHGEMLMNQAELAEVQGLYNFCRIFKSFEVDHIIPLNGVNVSGLHVLGNLQVLSKFLNRSKGNKITELTN